MSYQIVENNINTDPDQGLQIDKRHLHILQQSYVVF